MFSSFVLLICVSSFVLFLWVGVCLLLCFLRVSKWCFPCNAGVFGVVFVQTMLSVLFLEFVFVFLVSCLGVGMLSVLSFFCQKRHNRLFARLVLILIYAHLF